MCGSVITTGGFFLFVMNIYNYHMLEKEKRATDRERNQTNIENQEQMSISAAEMEQPEAEETEMSAAQQDPESAETKWNVIALFSVNAAGW